MTPSVSKGQRRYRSWCREMFAREQNTIRKNWSGRIPVALIYPNRYSAGMSNLGFQLLYQLFNAEPDVVCERAFLPEGEWSELGHPIAPISLESQSPLGRFEILAVSAPFENDYCNFLYMLVASGIPLKTMRRQPPDPFVWIGGVAASLNPEPLAEYVDLVAIGEGEELIAELLKTYRYCRDRGLTKSESLEAMSTVEGVYVPSFYQVRYDKLGKINSFRPRGHASMPVRRRVTKDLSRIVPASWVLTPVTEFKSLFLVEIGRGCPWRCRFCAAGHILGPPRHRRLKALIPVLEAGLKMRNRIGLISSSVCNHPQLNEILDEILARDGEFSLASVRLDYLDDQLLERLKRSGQRTLSLAPEAGSQRLRDIIQKGLSEEQILSAAERAAAAGIRRLRLYFMVGLPSENWDDINSIVGLVKRMAHRAVKITHGQGMERITLSLSPFVPKPFTPFQWHPFLEVDELKARIRHLLRSLKREGRIHVIYDLPKWTRIQALLARGDRRLGQVLTLVAAGKDWKTALEEVNINPDFYLHRTRDQDEHLPWDFIGYDKDKLWKAYEGLLSDSVCGLDGMSEQ